MSIFASRAAYKLGWFPGNPVLEVMMNPLTVFILFMTAAIIVLYPWMKGPKTVIIAPIVVIVLGIFVYAYYILP